MDTEKYRRLWKKAQTRIKRSFLRFKRKMLVKSQKEEIWDSCMKVHFYLCMNEYFEYNEGIPETYLQLAVAEPELLEKVWRLYLREEHLDYRTWKGIDELLEALLERWRLPLAG